MKNKNKFWGMILAILIVPIAIIFTACGKTNDGDVKISSYEFVDCVTEYEDTDTFSATGKLVFTLSDGSTKEVKLTNEMLKSVPDLTTVGEKKVIYIYDEVEYELTITIKMSEKSQKNALAVQKLYESLAKYVNSSKDEDVSLSVDFSYLANILNMPIEGNYNLANGELSSEEIDSIALLSKLMENVTNATVNGENANILDVLMRDVPEVDNEALQNALNLLSISKITSERNIADVIFSVVSQFTAGEVYDSLMDMVIDEEIAEELKIELAGNINVYLKAVGYDNYELAYSISSGIIDSVKSYDAMTDALDVILSTNLEELKSEIIEFTFNYVFTADKVGDYIAQRFDITDEEIITEIKAEVENVYNFFFESEDVNAYLTGEKEWDLVQIWAKYIVTEDGVELITNKLIDAVCANLEITEEEGELAVKEYFDENVLAVIDYLANGYTSSVDWRSKVIELATLILEYSNTETVLTVNYAIDCYENKHMEDLICVLMYDTPDFYTYRTDKNGEFDEYASKIDEITALYDDLYEIKYSATKTLMGYIIYRKDIEKTKTDLNTYIESIQPIKTEINEKLNALSDDVPMYVYMSWSRNFDFLRIYFANYTGIYALGMENYDFINLTTLEVINQGFNSSYGDLLTNFVSLNLDRQIVSDLMGLANGEIASINVVFDNLADTLSQFVLDNEEDLVELIQLAGEMIGLDASKYLDQLTGEDDVEFTLIKDYLDMFLTIPSVEEFNKAQFGENYEQFKTTLDTLTINLGSLILGDTSRKESVLTATNEILSLISENNVGQIAYFVNGDGEIEAFETAYIFIALDLLDMDVPVDEKIRQYLPMFADETTIKEEFVDILYMGILDCDYDVEDYYASELTFVPVNKDAYDACVELVEKHYSAFMNEEFNETELKEDLLNLVIEHGDKAEAVTADLISKLSWDVYLDALFMGNTEANVPEAVKADVENLIYGYISAYQEELVVIVTSYLAEMMSISNIEDIEELLGLVDRYFDYCLDRDAKYDIDDYDALLADFDTFISEKCNKRVNLVRDILTSCTGDLFYDLLMAFDMTVDAYSEEIGYTLQNIIAEFVGASVSFSDIGVIVLDEDMYSAIGEWSDDFVNAWIDDTLDLEASALELIEVITPALSDGQVLALTIAMNLTGDLYTDVLMIANTLVTVYEENIKYELTKEIYYHFVDFDITDETSYALIEDVVDYAVDSYLDGSFDIDVFGEKILNAIVSAPSLSRETKLGYALTVIPVLESFGAEVDYNNVFNAIIDINSITDGAIKSIDYNRLFNEIFYEGFLNDDLIVPEVITTNVEFNEAGEMVSETLVYAIKFGYRASVMTFNSELRFTLTINY